MAIASYSQCLVINAEIAGIPARTLIDSGAQGNYVNPRVAHQLNSYQRKKSEPYTLSGFNGSDQGQVNQELRDINLNIDGHVEPITLDVTPMKYDLVLGMAWLKKHNPLINWSTRLLTFPNCRHFGLPSSKGTTNITKAIWVRPQGRTLASVEPVECPKEYEDFKDVFEEKLGKDALPEHKPWDHEIPLIPGKEPTYGPLYTLTREEEIELKTYIEKNLAKGFIRESSGPAASPILFVPKKDKTKRLCVDFRKLNEITVKNRYPLPRIDELQDRLQGMKWFTAIDIREAYYRIRIKQGEEWKTAFRTRYGQYEYCVMPFGLTNAPASFQSLINNALREYLDDFVVAYLDDVLIFSKTYEEHVQHVRKVLTKLREKGLPVKLEKCEFHKHEVPFLGYIVSDQGLKMSPDKIKDVLEWPEPRSVKDVQSFLGFANFYRRFIEGYSRVTAALSNLTKKGVQKMFALSADAREAFLELKRRFTSAPLLLMFDPEKPIHLETDASDYAIGACILQPDDNGKWLPVAYHSRKLTGPELNYEIYDKELLAIVEALRHWRVYCEGPKYTVDIYSDHKNLLYWTTTKKLHGRLIRWSETMSAYNFRIHYVKGKENGRADALSRRPDYEEGSKVKPSDALLKVEGDSLVFNRTIMMAERSISTPISAQDKLEALKLCHDDTLAGHPGVNKTLELLTRDYSWKGMRADVEEYVGKCMVCQKARPSRHKPYGLLQPTPVPEYPWQTITWDFIVELPKSEDPLTGTAYDSILVICDRMTKYSYFLPCNTTTNAKQLAYLFMRTVFAEHGMPKTIISDRGSTFTSQFLQTLMNQLGTKAKFSTAFHPETDGQTERTNQTLEQYLRCYINHRQDNWVSLLPLAQFCFNNNTAVTGVSPFYANYGFHPNFTRNAIKTDRTNELARLTVEQMKELHEHLKTELEFIAQRMARFANRHRIEGPTLSRGDPVYLIRKNIKTKRPNSKLDFKKLGPFKIKDKLGPVTYRLQLPKNMKIHPVFHIALLEPANPETPLETSQPLEQTDKEYDVEEVLGFKWENNRRMFLIKWLDYDPSENSWEPETNLNKEVLRQIKTKNPDWFILRHD